MTQQSGRILLGALVAMLVVVGTAIAGPLEDAEVAYNSSDYTTAMRLYRSLADEGNAEAQVAIAIMYGRGEGVPQNYAEAAKWYRKAADQGNFMAQADLGILYEEGRGVPQNYVQAHKWFNLGATAWPKKTRRQEIIEETTRQYGPSSLGIALLNFESRNLAAENRDKIAAKMTSAQIAEAQKLASEWKPKQ
jgi:hypothetical protein